MRRNRRRKAAASQSKREIEDTSDALTVKQQTCAKDIARGVHPVRAIRIHFGEAAWLKLKKDHPEIALAIEVMGEKAIASKERKHFADDDHKGWLEKRDREHYGPHQKVEIVIENPAIFRIYGSLLRKYLDPDKFAEFERDLKNALLELETGEHSGGAAGK